MKTNQFYLLFAGLLLALLTALPNATRAQVKVGSNYSTIGSNSNLEVEATNGKKVIVNKADGSMVIETTPTSTSASDLLLGVDGTGKVVTVDRTTVVNSVTAAGNVGLAPHLRVEGTWVSSGSSPTVFTIPKNLSVTANVLMTYNGSAGTITIPSTGVYFYAMSVSAPDRAGVAQNDVCLVVAKGSTVLDRNCARGAAAGSTAVTSGIYNFAANDTVFLQYTTASNVGGNVSYDITINIYKISD